ncbi:MBL fold metallo-hydrolase [Pseudoduganella buxea]|uniref:Ribonuclease Z n=1 Tax=Pseudoduganella buxea TaxID=1949069 RepID=A0A6I3SY57_9BURK|nr:MBL fold metallo-hydrolase [Pseudoduganella buxea]MTV54148.1 MBL fold metallo-hydrolase [Pseudoduganella buxea]GGC14054.1 ribonuclease Z [Pseudoduganella buxea]
MELEFLGTSSGTPTRTRNVAGVALRLDGGGWLLVDCGEGTQHRILQTTLSLHALRAVFITHLHGDHCYGLPGLLASAGMANRTEPLTVVGPPPLDAYLQGVMATTALHLPYEIHCIGVGEAEAGAPLSGVNVSVTALSHRLPSYAYGFAEAAVERRLDTARLRADGVPPGPAWGRLQQGDTVTLPDGRILQGADYLQAPRKARKIVIAGDNDTPALLAQELAAADVLVHEATYTDAVLAKVGPGPQHSSARMVAQCAAEAKLPNLVLTHFSPRYQDDDSDGGPPGLTLAALRDEAQAHYGGNLLLASDLARYRLDRDGTLVPVAPVAADRAHQA